VQFFEQVVMQAFKGGSGTVYVLPETLRPNEAFGSYDIDENGAAKPVPPR